MSIRGEILERIASFIEESVGQSALVATDEETFPHGTSAAIVVRVDGQESVDDESGSFGADARILPVSVVAFARRRVDLLELAELVDMGLAAAVSAQCVRDFPLPSFASIEGESERPIRTAVWAVEAPYRVDVTSADTEA